ncbi:MAG: beta-agarase, partial [Maribacter dokdonensis]
MKFKFLILSSLFLFLLTASNCNSSSDVNETPDVEVDNKDLKEGEEKEKETEEDYSTMAVPADPGSGLEWKFQDVSDDFEYEAPAGNKGDAFFNKWDDFYHNNWSGPGLTEWSRDIPFVAD